MGRSGLGRRWSLWRATATTCVLAGVLVLPSSAVALANFTWSGASSDHRWSTGANWVGGTSPNGSVGTLTFPTLTSPACTAIPPTAGCFSGDNDISGLTVNALSIDSANPYTMQGNGITLGAGGLSASTPNSQPTFFLDFPITLGDPQTWTIGGGSTGAGVGLGQAVSGTSDALVADLQDTSGLNLAGDTEVGAFNAVGSDSTQTGANALGNGTIYDGDSLNGTDGNAVRLTDVALNVSNDASIGPLTSTGAGLELSAQFTSQSVTGSILSVDGGVTLDSTSSTEIQVEGPGTTAGSDYSQMSATGPIDLSGTLDVFDSGTSTCPSLDVGDIDTLITTTGTLSGTFTGVPDGTVVQFDACGNSGPTVRINYTAHSVTATVVTAGAPSSSSTLTASPSNPVTNQPVTLTATITAASGSPSGGTVGFDDLEGPIAGCDSQPVAWTGATGTATCQTSFAADSSPEELFAEFTPTNASVQASGGGPVDVTIGQDATATGLTASNVSPTVGQSVTYTASVTPADAGPVEPSGTVEFLDGAAAITACASQPLTAGATATCTVNYSAVGAHSITASYSGDGNFTGSTSPTQAVDVQSSASPANPSNTAAPAASGALTVGQTVSTTTGAWSGSSPITYGYQWQLCNPGCAAISGATSSSYTLVPADAGASIEAVVTATNSVGSAQASSNTLGPVAPSGMQIMAALASALSPHGKAATIGALLMLGGYRSTVTAPGPGTLAITWYFLPSGAHLSKARKAQPVAIASAHITVSKAERVHMTVRLTPAGRHMLTHARTLKVVSKASFRPAGGKATTRTARFTLRR